jgi:predicted DCC family thiol-disulfide oxidoreductase YuxK/uncharacterized membrane protein YphA (DoxX/SURF4 family)
LRKSDKWSVDHFIFAEYSTGASALGIYRILFAACILLVYLPEHLWISSFPDSFFNPPIGPTALFWTGLPSARFFRVLNVAEIFAALSLLVGYRTRLASVALGLLLFVGNCWAASFGRINHDILMIIVPLVMQFANWGAAYSVDETRVRNHPQAQAWPLALLALITAFGMMSAAEPKAVSGWLDPHSHAVLGHLTYNALVTGRANWIVRRMLKIHSDLFWESLDYMTVLLEASFLFLVGRRRTFRLACGAACFFHLGIAITMQIAYWPNLLAYGAFCNWSVVEGWPIGSSLQKLRKNSWLRLTPVWLVGLGAAVSLMYLSIGNPLHKLSDLGPSDADLLGTSVCVFAAIVAAISAGLVLSRAFARPLPGRSVVLFDGMCALCDGWVDFILRHDRDSIFRFSALQSEAGRAILKRIDPQEELGGGSIVLVEDEQVYCRSTAILRILRGLGLPFSPAYAAIAIPRTLRDYFYNVVAVHRLRWFGERETCRIPTPGELSRFL